MDTSRVNCTTIIFSRLKLDLIPRDGLDIVELNNSSISHLYKLHERGSQKDKSDKMMQRNFCKMQPFNVFICLKNFGYRINEDVIVYFHLCDKQSKQISERFAIDVLCGNGDTENHQNDCCIFTELGESNKCFRFNASAKFYLV